MQNVNIDKAQRDKGRRDFVLLMAIFFTPIVIALILYANLDKWQITSTSNHGNLIQPPHRLQDVSLTDIRGESFHFSNLRDKWILVQLGSAGCDKQCENRLYLVRQIRLAQGDNLHRVKRLYISTEGRPAPSLIRVMEQHPELEVVYGDKTVLKDVMEQFGHDIGQGKAIQSVYIVDPRGFLIMSYPEGFEPKGMIKDLTRLLKYARAG